MARRKYRIVNTPERLELLRNAIERAPAVGFDTETTGLDVHAPDFELVGVSVATDPYTGWYVPTRHLEYGGLSYQGSNVRLEEVRDLLITMFEKTRVVMHNAAYDRPVLKRTLDLDFSVTKADDTKLALHLLDENGRQSLKDRARQYLGIEESKKRFSDVRRQAIAFWDEQLIQVEKVSTVSKKTGRRYMKNEYSLVPGWLRLLVRDFQLTNSGAESITYVFDYWRNFLNHLKRRAILEFDVAMPNDFRYVPSSIATLYAGDDAINTLELWLKAEPELNRLEVRHLYEDLQLPVDDVMMRASWEGVLLDESEFDRMRKLLNERLDVAHHQALTAAARLIPGELLLDGTFNPETLMNSNVQLQKLLFDIVGFTPVKTTQAGNPSVDSQSMAELLKQVPKNADLKEPAHDLIRAKQQIADISKILGTYVDGLPELMDDFGLVHPNYNVTGTVSGRMSSSKPNYQNMPRLTPEEVADRPHLQGIDIRRGMVAPEGWVFASQDFVAMEMVVCAALSGDENMQQLLANGADMHAYTARHAFNIGWDLTDSEFKREFPWERQLAKIANFGIIYGGSEYTFVNNFGMTEEQARNVIDGYFKAFPKVKLWMDEVYDILRKDKQIRYPIYGYIKRMDNPNQWERRQFAASLRSCQNAMIQGLSALWVKEAIVNIDKRLREEGLNAFVSYQIHDEIGCLAPEEEAAQVMRIMQECMEGDIMGVKLRVDGEVTRTMSTSAENLLESLVA